MILCVLCLFGSMIIFLFVFGIFDRFWILIGIDGLVFFVGLLFLLSIVWMWL